MTRRLELMLFGACAVVMAAPTYAQDISYDIPAGDLATVLDAYGRQAGREVVYRVEDVRGARSPGVRGPMSPDAALRALLAGTSFTFERDGSGAVAIVRQRAATSQVGDSAGAIVVTGTRIRGGRATSPVVTVTEEEMRNAGQATLGDVARNLPQSFGGGQNPGVTQGAQGANNVNVSAASTINLRGLGPDATLTLLNGRRLAYDYAFQGIDISGIPIAAVDRLEIVADGASAIYGSDAVGGVANIILKRDYSGLSTSARFGASTAGGNEQQQYSVVGGHTWSNGGALVAYDYQKNTPIVARNRSYMSGIQDDQTLLPGLSQHSVIFNGHQELSSRLTLSADATFNHRRSEFFSPTTFTAPPSEEGLRLGSRVRSYSVSPRLDFELTSDWSITLTGTYARSKSNTDSAFNAGGTTLIANPALYDNRTRLVEMVGDGRVFQINGNDVRLAIGAGYRANSLDQELGTITPTSPPTSTSLSGESNSYYGFGEVELPLISPANDAGIYRLSITGAVRYENYDNGDEVATPKLGAILAPTPDIELKASWGRSFKAPTLYQLHNIPTATLWNSSRYGIPTPGTAISVVGGNPELRSERATTWSATATVTPRSIEGLRLEASYFRVNYSDRVVSAPISGPVGAVYANPAYQSLITYNPSLGQIEDAIALAPQGLQLRIPGPFDPANVVAILDGRNVNVSRQRLHGVDLFGSYDLSDDTDGRLTISALGSYLVSRQTLFPDQPPTQLSGTIYDPPKWRARGSVTWVKGLVTLNASANYSGPLVDDRQPEPVDIGAAATFDITARVRSAVESGFLAGMELALSALNVFDRKPRAIAAPTPGLTPYDSTNDSAVGRFVSLTLTKAW